MQMESFFRAKGIAIQWIETITSGIFWSQSIGTNNHTNSKYSSSDKSAHFRSAYHVGVSKLEYSTWIEYNYVLKENYGSGAHSLEDD